MKSLSDSEWDFAARLVGILRTFRADEQIAALQRLRDQGDLKPDVFALVEVLLHLSTEDQSATSRGAWAPGDEPIPGYRLLKCLGQGGFGEVWKADIGNDFHVALKVVNLRDPYVARLELRALDLIKQVRHPHLLSVRRSWTTVEQLILEMELADCSLDHRLHEARSQGLTGIPHRDLLRYMGEAAEGIDYLNSFVHCLPDEADLCAIQHRDIKPGNLLLQGGGVKVADFGLAKSVGRAGASHTGARTPGFAPPEAERGRTEPQSDQYSLAVTYYVLRTGLLLESLDDLSTLPCEEAGVLARALAHTPEDRWPSCHDFVTALDATFSHTPGTAKIPSSAATFMEAEQTASCHAPPQEQRGSFPSAPPEALLNCLQSFTAFINGRTTNAVPREFVIGELDAFLAREPSVEGGRKAGHFGGQIGPTACLPVEAYAELRAGRDYFVREEVAGGAGAAESCLAR